MEELKIEKGQHYAVAGTDSSFEVKEIEANGDLGVAWAENPNSIIKLSASQVNDFIKSGQLKLVPAGGEVTQEAKPAAPAAEPAAEPVAEKKGEAAAPETSERLRAPRVVRHIPTEKYIDTMKRALAMTPEEFTAMMGSRPVKEAK